MRASPKLPLQIAGISVTGTWIGIFVITLIKFQTVNTDILYRILSICLLAIITVGPISWFLGKALLYVKRQKKTSDMNDLILDSSLIQDIPSEDSNEENT